MEPMITLCEYLLLVLYTHDNCTMNGLSTARIFNTIFIDQMVFRLRPTMIRSMLGMDYVIRLQRKLIRRVMRENGPSSEDVCMEN